jgi:PIN domain nuclease of toxin-antitoxin system
VKLLLDTHLVLWAASEPERLSKTAVQLIEDRSNQLIFSAASIHEVAIKSSLGRPDFKVKPDRLLRGLLLGGYLELPVSAEHSAKVFDLPPIQRDPFDRILIAQAIYEGLVFLTVDQTLGPYSDLVRIV